MATKTSRRPAARPAARRAPSKPKGGRPPRRPAAWRSHAPDALGLAVLFGSILMCLSLAQSAGPVGRGVEWVLRGGWGAASYLVPLATLLIALAAFIRRDEAGRILIGTALITSSVAGFVHLVRGTPLLTGGYRGLARAGGIIGGVLAIPLESYVGTWAGALACVFLGLLGVLITTKTPLKRAAEAAWRGLALMGRGVGKLVGKLLAEHEPSAPHLTVVAPEPASSEPDAEPESEGRRKRATLTPVPLADTEPPLLSVAPIASADTTVESPLSTFQDADTGKLFEQPTLALKLPKPAYKLPSPSLLKAGKVNRARGADEASRVLERTLADFGVDAAVTGVTRGPTVSQFEIELGAGVKVQSVLSLEKDIGYALGSADVRMLAPIPGKSAIGVEVPNRDRDLVTLGDLINSAEWRAATHPLSCALGKDIAGHTIVVNLAEMPHLLIAGTTGAGKSSCLNSLLTSMLLRARPDELKLILIDPKMVELTNFDHLPHLLAPVVTHPKQAAETLGWVVREMERRYEVLKVAGLRNLELYNAAVDAGTVTGRNGEAPERLCYMAVVIDELADLMMIAKNQVEDAICRIAQMARAVGIHLVVATQRPSVDVVTGLIKANIPSRIAFSVASQSDSRVILDVGGAEKLVGRGDMLYLPIGTSKPKRIQGSFISETELKTITDHVRAQQPTSFDDDVMATVAASAGEADDEEDGDPLFDEAMELVIRTQMGSTSMLQRKLKVGFSRAGRLMDLLERRGVVGPQEGSKARAVLLSVDDLYEMRKRMRGDA